MDSVFFQPADTDSEKKILFEVPPGKNFKEVCKILEEKEIISDWFSVYYISRIKGSSQQIKAGEYSLSPGFPPSRTCPESPPLSSVAGVLTLRPALGACRPWQRTQCFFRMGAM